MNGSRTASAALLNALKRELGGREAAQAAVCPSYLYIPLAAELLAGSAVAWGGQDVDTHASGAYTGAVSVAMLKDYACTYAIVGHSERRTLYGDTDSLVAEKYAAAQAGGLIPIFCVGETLAEREGAQTEAVVGRQLDAVLGKSGIASIANSVIAYEPVWAIGTGKTATPQQAQDVHAFIRGKLSALDRGIAAGVRILYGGSVKGSNAKELFAQSDIDGGLIGGASLQADEFVAIVRAAN
jgi:triosephosphate isomerase